MWDQIDVCAKQYRCLIDYYVISFLSKSYQIDIDGADGTLGRKKRYSGWLYFCSERILSHLFDNT